MDDERGRLSIHPSIHPRIHRFRDRRLGERRLVVLDGAGGDGAEGAAVDGEAGADEEGGRIAAVLERRAIVRGHEGVDEAAESAGLARVEAELGGALGLGKGETVAEGVGGDGLCVVGAVGERLGADGVVAVDGTLRRVLGEGWTRGKVGRRHVPCCSRRRESRAESRRRRECRPRSRGWSTRQRGCACTTVGSVRCPDRYCVHEQEVTCVVGDTLVSLVPREVALRSVDGHEALEDVLVEDALRVLGALVGHEAVDEGEGGLGDFNTGKGVVGWMQG